MLLAFFSTWTFIGIGAAVVAALMLRSLFFPHKNYTPKNNNNQQSGNTDYDQFDLAIQQSIEQKQQLIKDLAQSEDIYKTKLEWIYKAFDRPQHTKTVLYHYKGKKVSKDNNLAFERTYGALIQSTINERLQLDPSLEHFTVKREVHKEFNNKFFNPSYYYEGEYIDNLDEKTVLQSKEKIEEVREQIDIIKEMIAYHDNITQQLTDVKHKYQRDAHLSSQQEILDRISENSLAAKVDLELLKEDTEHETLVYQEFKKLTADYYANSLSDARRELIKNDLNKMSLDFAKKIKHKS